MVSVKISFELLQMLLFRPQMQLFSMKKTNSWYLLNLNLQQNPNVAF